MTLPNIEFERIKRDMKKKELANLLGVTPRTIQNWQNGATEIPMSKLILLSNTWKLSADYLLGLAPMG